MKKILLLILFSAYILNAYSQLKMGDTISFEKNGEYVKIDTSQKNNIWQIGKPQKTFFNSAYSKPYAIVTDTINPYPINNTSSFVIKTWIAGGAGALTIDFMHKYETDSLKDGGYIEVSIDNGATWMNIASLYSFFYPFHDTIEGGIPAFTGKSNGWVHAHTSILCEASVNDSVLVKFTFKSDSINNNKEGWMIDNLIFSIIICEGIVEHSGNIAQVNVYPNPANTNITLSYQLPQNESKGMLNLYNTMGQLISSGDITSSNGTIDEDVSALSGGIYYYTLSVNGVVMATNKLAIIR
jgi:hypothetical protein